MRRLLRIAACVAAVSTIFGGAGAWASSGGSQRWTASYHFGDKAFSDAVAVTPDGSTVFVTGTTDQGESDSHFATLAYDASTGAEKWVATFLLATDHDQYGRGNAIAVSPDGSTVYVTGSTACFRCQRPVARRVGDRRVRRRVREPEWVARFRSGVEPGSVAVSPDGEKVFVNGSTGDSDESETIAYAASDGDSLWAVHSDDSPVYARTALKVSPNGSTVYVASTTAGDGFACRFDSGGYRTTAMSAVDGSSRWSSTFRFDTGQACGRASDLALSRDGSTVWVTGYGGPSQGDSDQFRSGTVAYDAHTGARLWDQQDDRMRVTNSDISVYLAATPDGSEVFALGSYCDASSPSCEQRTLVTAAYDGATGSRLWLSHFDGGGQGWPTGLVVSPDGSSLFESGSVNLPCASPCTQAAYNGHLIAYDTASGGEQWVATYPNNVPWGLAVSPDGSSVYEAGGFTGAASTSLDAIGAAASRRCVGAACGYSLTGYNTQAGPGTFQESDPSIRYDGWKNVFAKSAVGGAFRASDVRGATATFHTAATSSIRWLTHRGPNAGRARVVVDGHVRRIVDLYAAKPSDRAVAFERARAQSTHRHGHGARLKTATIDRQMGRGRRVPSSRRHPSDRGVIAPDPLQRLGGTVCEPGQRRLVPRQPVTRGEGVARLHRPVHHLDHGDRPRLRPSQGGDRRQGPHRRPVPGAHDLAEENLVHRALERSPPHPDQGAGQERPRIAIGQGGPRCVRRRPLTDLCRDAARVMTLAQGVGITLRRGRRSASADERSAAASSQDVGQRHP